MPKPNQHDGKSRRLRERFELALPVRVRGRETLNYEWEEVSRLVDVTQFGARLSLTRPTEPGRLLYLTMPMPRPLRCFDHVEDQYRVWSLVRNLKLLPPDPSKNAIVEIGVAFVGKRPPKSFESDPTLRYEIAQRRDDADFWMVKEESDQMLSEMPVDEKRKETRHGIPIEILIEVFGKDQGFSGSEKTVTENISARGASVFTTLDVAPGNFVRISNDQFGARVLAVVRTRRVGEDHIPRLHLEFVAGKWPLEGIS